MLGGACPRVRARPVTTPGGRSRVAAALFALLLGGLGVHKFYLGQVGLGIVYLTQSDEQFAARYG